MLSIFENQSLFDILKRAASKQQHNSSCASKVDVFDWVQSPPGNESFLETHTSLFVYLTYT
jgi:hypothetical protein